MIAGTVFCGVSCPRAGTRTVGARLGPLPKLDPRQRLPGRLWSSMRFASVHCIGGCVIDRSGETAEREARLHTSNIGTLVRSHGGAARNVAENLARLGVPVSLSTVVGGDEDGREVLAATEAAGVDVSRCVVLE